jgi:hypothetical protein
MYYDLKNHRYVLKPEYIRDTYAIELAAALDTSGSINARKAVEGFLKRASMVLYNYIYQHNPSQKEYVEYRMAKFPDAREKIQEAMGELVYYWLMNNVDLTLHSGINVETGKLYNRADINLNTVPHSVELILSSAKLLSRSRFIIELDQEYIQDKDYYGIDW